MAIDPQRMAEIMQRVKLAGQGSAPQGAGMDGGLPTGTVNAPPPPDAPPGTAAAGVPTKISGTIMLSAQSGEHVGQPPTQVHIEGTVMLRPIIQGAQSANQPGMAPAGPAPMMPPGGMQPR